MDFKVLLSTGKPTNNINSIKNRRSICFGGKGVSNRVDDGTTEGVDTGAGGTLVEEVFEDGSFSGKTTSPWAMVVKSSSIAVDLACI